MDEASGAEDGRCRLVDSSLVGKLPEPARQPSSGEIIPLVRNLVVGLGGTSGDADPPPDQERSTTDQHDPCGRPEPEEGNRNPSLWAEHPHKPD